MLILASGSPRRRELIQKITKDFRVVVPNVDEGILHLPPNDLPGEESKMKAYAVKALFPDEEVLACDTIVVLDGKVLGKPKDEKDARLSSRDTPISEKGRKSHAPSLPKCISTN